MRGIKLEPVPATPAPSILVVLTPRDRLHTSWPSRCTDPSNKRETDSGHPTRHEIKDSSQQLSTPASAIRGLRLLTRLAASVPWCHTLCSCRVVLLSSLREDAFSLSPFLNAALGGVASSFFWCGVAFPLMVGVAFSSLLMGGAALLLLRWEWWCLPFLCGALVGGVAFFILLWVVLFR